jgi:ABC-type phosphate transport system substrate-binding protein
MRIMRFIIVFWCALAMGNTAMAEDNQSAIAIIVASHQNIEDLKFVPNQLSLIYWRKQLFWPKGVRIKPVNLSSEHPLRQQFSQAVLGSPPKAQIDYWNGQYFNGVLPPYSVNSEEAVLRYVAQTTGAIGYIDACNIDERVKPLLWIHQDAISTHAPDNLSCK